MPPKQTWVLGLWPWLAHSLGGWAAIPIPKVQGCCPLGLSIGFKILVVSQPLRTLPPWDISVLAIKFK